MSYILRHLQRTRSLIKDFRIGKERNFSNGTNAGNPERARWAY